MNAPASLEPSPAPRRHVLKKLGLALAGLAVGLVAAELIFWVRDDGGFPKLNVYVADPVLGVRLAPGATERLVFPGNPTTSVRINRDGYRGGAFPTPGADDVLIVGDSQVFGLGVEEHETFAAQLDEALGAGRHVLNGGVPTYGPEEYAAVARELVTARQARTVVFTVNVVNDLFEAGRPNRGRHVVRDGWAVRSDVASAVTDFPGRAQLARRSHLFYALRSLWHTGTDGQLAASEGTWEDLVTTGAKTSAKLAATQSAQQARTAALQQTERALTKSAAELDGAIVEVLSEELSDDDRLALDAAHRQPGDIVEAFEPNLEEGRPVVVTAAHIARGAKLRAKLRAKLARAVAAERDAHRRQRILANLDDVPRLAARLDELGLAKVAAALESPVAPALRELKQFCDARGVRLVVLILPLDVAVDPQEWTKYGAPAQDMSSVAALHAEILELGARLGVSTLDATAALRAAEPGAFLDHDIHMTPRGHAAVARALAETLATPAPAPMPTDDVSPIPLPAQWNAVNEITVPGSSDARCETKVLRDWLRILCTPGDDPRTAPTEVRVTQDSSGRAMTLVMPRSASLLVPVRAGAQLTAEFRWPEVVRKLEVSWPKASEASARLVAAFTVVKRAAPAAPARPAAFASETDRAACACWHEVYDPQTRASDRRDPRCPGIYGELDPGCLAYLDSCAELVACVLKDPSAPPRPARSSPGASPSTLGAGSLFASPPPTLAAPTSATSTVAP